MVFKPVSGSPVADLALFMVRLLDLSRHIFTLGAIKRWLHRSNRSLGLQADVVARSDTILAARRAQGPPVVGLVGLRFTVGTASRLDLESGRFTTVGSGGGICV